MPEVVRVVRQQNLAGAMYLHSRVGMHDEVGAAAAQRLKIAPVNLILVPDIAKPVPGTLEHTRVLALGPNGGVRLLPVKDPNIRKAGAAERLRGFFGFGVAINHSTDMVGRVTGTLMNALWF